MSFSQPGNAHELDVKLTTEFRMMMDADGQARSDSLAPRFKEHLKKALSDPETAWYSFDSLSQVISVTHSKNDSLRIFSWDEKSGGSWHDMAAFAQFKTAGGTVMVKQLDSEDEPRTGEATDSRIYEIHQVQINGKTHYLTIGWGTHGGGQHHVIVQIFFIEGEELVKCETCFEGAKDLVVAASRVDRINLKYKSFQKKIRHNDFAFNADDGFYYSTGKKRKWKLDDGTFRDVKRNRDS